MRQTRRASQATDWRTFRYRAAGGDGAAVDVAWSGSIDDLEALRPEWEALARNALEPNVFYEPCVLLPSLRHFARESELVLVLVFLADAGPAPAAPRTLVGLFPMVRGRIARQLPMPHLRMWVNEYSYVPTPLVHRAHAPLVVSAFFTWLASQPRSSRLALFENLPADGDVHEVLTAEAARRGLATWTRATFDRSMLAPREEASAYLARVLSRRQRMSLDRRRRRLSEAGTVEIVELTTDDDLDAWAQAFVDIERSGWKGRAGTAFASRGADVAYLKQMFRGAFAAGKLSSTALTVDGRKIAIQILLHAGDGAYAFKSAYDEAYARFGPGVLLEIDLIARTVRSDRLAWIDSATEPDHDVLNRLWAERRPIRSWLVTPDRALGRILGVLPTLRKIALAISRR